MDDFREDCSTCEHSIVCPVNFIDQQTGGCPDWDGWHPLKVASPYEPDVDEEVTIIISCGDRPIFDQAFLQEDGMWHTKTGKKYENCASGPVLAWRKLHYIQNFGEFTLD